MRSFSAVSSEVALAGEAPTAGGARGHLVGAGQMLDYTPESEILPVKAKQPACPSSNAGN